jgi:hypothetical protein
VEAKVLPRLHRALASVVPLLGLPILLLDTLRTAVVFGTQRRKSFAGRSSAASEAELMTAARALVQDFGQTKGWPRQKRTSGQL